MQRCETEISARNRRSKNNKYISLQIKTHAFCILNKQYNYYRY